ncbi:MAG TPA: hypothetical protein VGP72_26455 [Planctomycetota bacterium]|jgi:uncharacterized membrane protein
MTLGIIFALTCGLLWAFIGVLYSTMARHRMQFFAVMGPAFIVTAIAAWVFLADYHTLFSGKTNGTASLAWLMIPSGILTVLGMVCMQTAMRRGHHAACWTIGQSALIAPYLCGVFFFGEPLLARKAFGVALILASLVAFGRARRETETEEPACAADAATARRRPANGGWGWLGLSIACLALLSVQQTLTTLPSHWPNWTDSLRLRVPLMFTGVALAYGSGALLTKQRPCLIHSVRNAG